MKLIYKVLILLFSLPAVAGEIAITFDDAPLAGTSILSGEARTKKIIAALQDGGVEDAMFFVATKNIRDEAGVKRLQQYVDAGFHLASHSHSHQSASKIPEQEFIADVARAKSELEKFEGVLPYFRFPYLHYGKDKKSIESIQAQLAELGYSNGYVTVDNYDWYLNKLLVDASDEGKTIDMAKAEQAYVDVLWAAIEFYDGLALEHLQRSPKHVLLLHENDAAAMFLPALIKKIRSEGWNIISPQAAYADPIAASLPDVTFQKQGRVAALARAEGVEESQLRHPFENDEALQKLVAERAVIQPAAKAK